MVRDRDHAASARWGLHLSERSAIGHISRIYEVFGLNLDDDGPRRVLAVTRCFMK